MKPFAIAAAAVLLASSPLAVAPARAADPAPAYKPPEDLFTNPVKPAFALGSPTDVVVRVDTVDITRGEIDREVGNMMNTMASRIPPEQMANVREQVAQRVVENLVNRQLLLAAADKAKIEVTDADVADARRQIEKSIPPGQSLDAILKAQGMDPASLNANIGRDLRIAKLLEAQTKSVAAPTDEEASKFYEQNKSRFQVPENVQARHILIAFAPSDTPEQKQAKQKKAEDLRAQLVKGEDFAKLAAANSDCPSKQRGGDLGTFGRGQMVGPFEQAAFAQKVGEIGPVVETQFGYHVIRVDAHNAARNVALDEAKARILQTLGNQRKQTAMQNYLALLRQQAKIAYPGGAAPAPLPAP
jgi:peptidyl-prolyl cis-trans isomerase C